MAPFWMARGYSHVCPVAPSQANRGHHVCAGDDSRVSEFVILRNGGVGKNNDKIRCTPRAVSRGRHFRTLSLWDSESKENYWRLPGGRALPNARQWSHATICTCPHLAGWFVRWDFANCAEVGVSARLKNIINVFFLRGNTLDFYFFLVLEVVTVFHLFFFFDRWEESRTLTGANLFQYPGWICVIGFAAR